MNPKYFKRDVKTVRGVLRRVLKIYEIAHWIRESFATKSKNDIGVFDLLPNNPKANCFCLRGALLATTNDESLVMRAETLLWKLIKKEYSLDKDNTSIFDITDWNDKIVKNKREVLALVKKGIKS